MYITHLALHDLSHYVMNLKRLDKVLILFILAFVLNQQNIFRRKVNPVFPCFLCVISLIACTSRNVIYNIIEKNI